MSRLLRRGRDGTRWPIAIAIPLAVVTGCGSQKPIAEGTLSPAQTPPPLVAQPTVSRATAPPTAARTTPRRPVATRRSREARPEVVDPSDAPGPLLSPAALTSFATLERQLGGAIGLAVSGVGFGQEVQTAGPLQSAIAWSTSKMPIAMAIYNAGLAGSQHQNLVAAITASDNGAAEALWNALGGGERAAQLADDQLRTAGDMQTSIQPNVLRDGYTPFGQTVWTLTNQTRFTAGMGCAPAGRDVLALMGETIAAQRWGLGSTGAAAELKGGWGPGAQPGAGGGYLDRQTGIVTIAGTPVALSIASLPSDGSHDTGTSNLTAVARWAVAHLNVNGLPRAPICS